MPPQPFRPHLGVARQHRAQVIQGKPEPDAREKIQGLAGQGLLAHGAQFAPTAGRLLKHLRAPVPLRPRATQGVDIEGGELELFSENFLPWISKVRVFIIEFYDRVRPGCAAAFYSAIRDLRFTQEQRGDTVMIVNEDLRPG